MALISLTLLFMYLVTLAIAIPVLEFRDGGCPSAIDIMLDGAEERGAVFYKRKCSTPGF